MRLTLNSLVLVLAITATTFAYDIQPSRAADIIAGPVHEMLSIASLECRKKMSEANLDVKHWNCLPLNMKRDYLTTQWAADLRRKVANWKRLDAETQYLLAGVRWPDDPIGTLRSNAPAQFLVHYTRCSRWLKGSYGPCANRFCLSHFGHLQMAHSMTPSAPWCKDRNPDSSTCAISGTATEHAIEKWIKWLIPIAKGKVKPSDPLFKNEYVESLFARECRDVYSDDFTYESLFFVDCSKGQWERIVKFWRWRKNWGTCKPVVPDQLEAQLAEFKARAVGAILHLIQDSYARGHTLRIPMSGTNWCSSRISCTKIIKISDYNEQNPGKHSDADETPNWDASCFGAKREVEDPITAGAKVLAMLDDPNSNADEIWGYLSGKVFLLDRNIAQQEKEEAIKKDRVCFSK